MFASQLPTQLFKMVAGRRTQVKITGSIVDQLQLPEHAIPNCRWNLLADLIRQIEIL